MPLDFEDSEDFPPKPDGVHGAGTKRRHHASLEYYLERFEAERSVEAQARGDASPPSRSPPQVA